MAEKFGNGQRRFFAQLQVKSRDVEAGKVESVVNAMVVWITGMNKGGVPFLEFAREHQIQFQMQMRALAIDSHTGVTHYRDVLPAMHRVAGSNVNFIEMPIQTEIRRAIPTMFDHDVFPVVRISGDRIGVDNFAIGDRAHFVQRLASLIAMKTANVDAFMKAGIDNDRARLFRVTHETVLAAFPRRRFFTSIIALDILIEVRAAAL